MIAGRRWSPHPIISWSTLVSPWKCLLAAPPHPSGPSCTGSGIRPTTAAASLISPPVTALPAPRQASTAMQRERTQESLQFARHHRRERRGDLPGYGHQGDGQSMSGLPQFHPCKAYLDDSRHLVFNQADGFARALRDGFFALRIPEELDLAPGIRFAQEFYQPAVEEPHADARYRGFRNLPDIYFDRENFQTEHILADARQRQASFPDEVNRLCERMHEIARLILREILGSLGVAPRLWPDVTGGTSEGRASPGSPSATTDPSATCRALQRTRTPASSPSCTATSQACRRDSRKDGSRSPPWKGIS